MSDYTWVVAQALQPGQVIRRGGKDQGIFTVQPFRGRDGGIDAVYVRFAEVLDEYEVPDIFNGGTKMHQVRPMAGFAPMARLKVFGITGFCEHCDSGFLVKPGYGVRTDENGDTVVVTGVPGEEHPELPEVVLHTCIAGVAA